MEEEMEEICSHCGYQGKTSSEYYGSCADCFWDYEEQFRKWRGSFNYYHEILKYSEEEADKEAKKEVEPWFLRYMIYVEVYNLSISQGKSKEESKFEAEKARQKLIAKEEEEEYNQLREEGKICSD
jgi:hypothetical protein